MDPDLSLIVSPELDNNGLRLVPPELDTNGLRLVSPEYLYLGPGPVTLTGRPPRPGFPLAVVRLLLTRWLNIWIKTGGNWRFVQKKTKLMTNINEN